MVSTARVFLRNLHPERALVLPLGDGRRRVLAPGVTTAVSATAARLPAIARLLAMQAITVVGTTPGSIASDAAEVVSQGVV